MISQVTWARDWLNWLIFECQGDTFDTTSLQWENEQVGFDIHCPCSRLAPLQPEDLSLQFLYPSLQARASWHGDLQLTRTCQVSGFTLLLALCCSAALAAVHSAAQCWQGQAQDAAMVVPWFLLSHMHWAWNSGKCCFFMALSSPVLSLAQQTYKLLEGSQPTEMGKFLWVKFSLKATVLPAEGWQHLCLLWRQNSLGPCPHAEEM